jgi:hypothetical protein
MQYFLTAIVSVTKITDCAFPRRQGASAAYQPRQLGDIRRDPLRLVGHNNQALSGSIDCSDFSCGWPMQAGRPFSRNSLWVIPQRTQALESKSKRCPRAVRSSGILALATQMLV